jgi:phosphoribosylformylglycinamidine synthase
MPRVAVIRFPGTNGDLDVIHVLRTLGLEARLVWHREFRHGDYDAVVLPGGFSYGDWLRAGAIASRSPAMGQVAEAAGEGKPVLGICNGFQVLTEAGLLDGSLLPNDPPGFRCRWVWVRVEDVETPFTLLYEPGEVVGMPIAHGEGRYLGTRPRVTFRYHGHNPNGSMYNIAGVANEGGNVLGLMPHPERSAEDCLVPRGFNKGGLKLWLSLRESLREGW